MQQKHANSVTLLRKGAKELMNKRRFQRSALLASALLLLRMAVPVVLTWREWRQEHLNRALIMALQRNKAQEAIALWTRSGCENPCGGSRSALL